MIYKGKIKNGNILKDEEKEADATTKKTQQKAKKTSIKFSQYYIMNKLQKSKEFAEQARYAALTQTFGTHSVFETLTQTYSCEKWIAWDKHVAEAAQALQHQSRWENKRWTYPRSTNLILPFIRPREQVDKFRELVDILFNTNVAWGGKEAAPLISRAIKLIEEGARFATPGEGGYYVENMVIWENLNGHCVPDRAVHYRPNDATRSLEIQKWRKNIAKEGYRCGWLYFPSLPPAPGVADNPRFPVEGELVDAIHDIQPVPVAAPAHKLRIDLQEARRKLRAARNLDPNDDANQHADLLEGVKTAFQGVLDQIGWEMPGGDLLLMLLKRKIPLQIVRKFFDYGLHGVLYYKCPINNHEKARRIMLEEENIEEGAALSFSIQREDPTWAAEYRDYFSNGWNLTKHRKIFVIHFFIQQYAQQCFNTDLPDNWVVISPTKAIAGKEAEFKYYQDFLKIIFMRNFLMIGEEDAFYAKEFSDDEDEPVIPGFRKYSPDIIDSPEFQEEYKKYFPK